MSKNLSIFRQLFTGVFLGRYHLNQEHFSTGIDRMELPCNDWNNSFSAGWGVVGKAFYFHFADGFLCRVILPWIERQKAP